jgi:hypothetical protein
VKRTAASRGPLRKILREERNEHGLLVEILECGHQQFQREDFIGPTNAYRRRCRKCKKGLPPEVGSA